MHLARRIALGVALAGALGVVAYRLTAPRVLPSPVEKPPPASPVREPARPVESAPALTPSASDLPTPTEAVRPSLPDDRLELVRRCLTLAETDPLAAMELAIAQQLTSADPGLLSALILRWAERDFSGALEWARAQPRDAARDDTLARLAYLRAQTDPLAAARIVVTDMPAGPIRDEAIVSVVHQWALRDRDAARAWADSFPESPLKSRVLAELQERPADT